VGVRWLHHTRPNLIRKIRTLIHKRVAAQVNKSTVKRGDSLCNTSDRNLIHWLVNLANYWLKLSGHITLSPIYSFTSLPITFLPYPVLLRQPCFAILIAMSPYQISLFINKIASRTIQTPYVGPRV
jgi:hypothetical protein